MDEIRLKIRAFIIDNFLFGRTDEVLSDEDSLIENGVIDSTGVLQLVAFLENDLGLRVEDDEIVPDNLDSLNKLIAFTARKQNLGARNEAEMWVARGSLSLAEQPTH